MAIWSQLAIVLLGLHGVTWLLEAMCFAGSMVCFVVLGFEEKCLFEALFAHAFSQTCFLSRCISLRGSNIIYISFSGFPTSYGIFLRASNIMYKIHFPRDRDKSFGLWGDESEMLASAAVSGPSLLVLVGAPAMESGPKCGFTFASLVAMLIAAYPVLETAEGWEGCQKWENWFQF